MVVPLSYDVSSNTYTPAVGNVTTCPLAPLILLKLTETADGNVTVLLAVSVVIWSWSFVHNAEAGQPLNAKVVSPVVV